jgi:hypothetical protein
LYIRLDVEITSFLNKLSADEAKVWLEEIVKKNDYSEFINPRHIRSSLSLDQIKASTSIIFCDGENFCKYFSKYLILLVIVGAYFTTWMECKVRRSDLLHPPDRHH